MVLGLPTKKKGATVKVEFQIQVQEIKPWRASVVPSGAHVPLLVQWQRGDNRSGRTRSAVPKQEDGGKIVFNDTFRLPAKLVREPATRKGRNTAGTAKFQKKTISFILQEATTSVQLARCEMDLAEYGDLHSSVPASIPLAVGKQNASGGSTPSLFLIIGPLGKEEKSFAARVSFGSSTPRGTTSKAPDKAVGVSGKSRVELALDEDTRRSLVAALLSDDDDNVSIESFTDDGNESTLEDSTPKSAGKNSEAPTTPESEMSSASAKGPESSEVLPRPPTNAGLESIPKSVNKSSRNSSSSTPPATGKDHTEGPTNNASRDSPTATKHGPGRATPSSAVVATDETVEKSRHVPTKQAPGTAPESSPSLGAGQIPRSSTSASASTASITRLFSADSVNTSSKVAGDFTSSTSRRTEILPSTPGSPLETENQSSEVAKREPLPEQQDEATLATVATDDTSNGGSNSSSSKANRISISSSESSQTVASKSIDRTGGSSSRSESKKPGEIAGTERSHSPLPDTSAKEEPSQETTSLLPPAPAKAAAASVASAYMASRTFGSFEGSSFDYLSENSEDSFSESWNSGRSPTLTPLRDQPHASRRSVPTSEYSVDAKRGENKGFDSDIVRSKISTERDEKRDDSKALHRNSPDAKTDIAGEPERKKETGDKHEESMEKGESVLGSARANLANMEKRALEELRTKITNAEAKLSAESQKVENLQGELRDVGAMEVSLYCVVAEHGSSSHKLHTPARRLARLYIHAHKKWTPERRAGTVKNCVSGLVTVAKSCGSDVSRLTFWWSNVVALRAIITQAFDKGLPSVSKRDKAQSSPMANANGNGSPRWARPKRSSFATRPSLQTPPTTPKPQSADWREASTYIAALEKIEEWMYSKIVESLWWQAMIPRMQKDVDASTPTSPKGMAMLSPSALFGPATEDLSQLAGAVTGSLVKKQSRRSSSLPELGDARQGNISVEVWKKAIMEAIRRLCPVRGAGHDCGCLPMLIKMAIGGCVARLDVALFNAILREPGDDVPTDPISDPVSDSSVLPISPGGLTFGGGSQLKNVVVTWSTFIAGLVSVKEPAFVPDAENADNTDTSEDSEKVPRFFKFMKATGDLLMLPKDILMDKNIRKEICPMLSLQLIRRILVNFVPDEFAPDPISPSLLAALNAEASLEKQREGEADGIWPSTAMAAAPPIIYVAPTAEYVWSWIGEASVDTSGWGRSNSSLLRKGYTSDEDLTVMEQLQKSSARSKLVLVMGSSLQGTSNGKLFEDVATNRSQSAAEMSGGSRFELLTEVWGSP